MLQCHVLKINSAVSPDVHNYSFKALHMLFRACPGTLVFRANIKATFNVKSIFFIPVNYYTVTEVTQLFSL